MLLVDIASIVVQLFPDLMSNFDNKLTIKIKLLCQAHSKVLRRIINVIDIPLKPILQTDIINLNIKFEDPQTFLIFWSKSPMIADCFFYRIDDLIFKGYKQGIFSDK